MKVRHGETEINENIIMLKDFFTGESLKQLAPDMLNAPLYDPSLLSAFRSTEDPPLIGDSQPSTKMPDHFL